jgi:hypothetical protein
VTELWVCWVKHTRLGIRKDQHFGLLMILAGTECIQRLMPMHSCASMPPCWSNKALPVPEQFTSR